MKKQTIMLFGDLHLPYHHKEAFDFLEAVKKKYKPTQIVCLGDLVDNHAISYHESNPDLFSAGDELRLATEYVQVLADIFPKLVILQGNHDRLGVRKARTVGLPSRFIRDNSEVFNMPKDWEWKFEHFIDMSDDRKLWLRHNLRKDALEVAKYHDVCFAQGHYHESFVVESYQDKHQNVFGATIGCLVDDTSLAMEYNKANLKRPQLGCMIIQDGIPKLISMELFLKYGEIC
jgi:predicted phosphodiesterase